MEMLMPMVAGHEMDVVFMYYDEPGVLERVEEFRKINPNVLMVEGVRGINQCHAAACEAADTEYFILIDGDNAPLPACAKHGPLTKGWSMPAMPAHINIMGFCARNAVTGLVSGHGGIKIVRKAAKDWFLGLDVVDYCMTPSWQHAPSGLPLTMEFTNLSPYHAFRSAYKEVMRLLRDPSNPGKFLGMWDDVSPSNKRAIWHWAAMGADADHGLDSIGGAAMALCEWANAMYAKEDMPAVDWFQYVYSLGDTFREWNRSRTNIQKTNVIDYCLGRFNALTSSTFDALHHDASRQVRVHLMGMTPQ